MATVATDSNTMDAYNVPKWLPAVRRPQLAHSSLNDQCLAEATAIRAEKS
jgi:hypothetical protein